VPDQVEHLNVALEHQVAGMLLAYACGLDVRGFATVEVADRVLESGEAGGGHVTTTVALGDRREWHLLPSPS